MIFLVRASVFVVLFVIALTATQLGADSVGVGLAMFAAFVLLATGWGVRDGRADRALPAVVTWFLVALALGVVMPLGTALVTGTWGATTLVRDTLGTLPFVLMLIFPPALMGIGIGALLRRGRSV